MVNRGYVFIERQCRTYRAGLFIKKSVVFDDNELSIQLSGVIVVKVITTAVLFIDFKIIRILPFDLIS